MLRPLSLRALLLAVAAVYFADGGRGTPLGMAVVELETLIRAPLWTVLGFGGVLGLLASVRGPPRRGPHPGLLTTTSRPPVRPGAILADGDWRSAVFDHAAQQRFPDGTFLDLRPGERAPFRLTITDVSPERARRAAAQLAALLAVLPLPPRVTIRFRGFTATGTPSKALVLNGFVQSFDRGAFLTTEEGDTVVVRFRAPDPRWSAD